MQYIHIYAHRPIIISLLNIKKKIRFHKTEESCVINVYKTRLCRALHNSIGVSLCPPDVITLEFREGKHVNSLANAKKKGRT